MINFEGKVITKPIYEEISSVKYKEGEILAKKNGKCGVINNKGKKLIPFEYEEIEGDKYYKNGYKETGYIVKTRTEEGYRYGYINSSWKKILNPDYTGVSRILDIQGKDIYLIASKNGQYGIIKNKKEEVDFKYQSITYNSDTNLFAVQRSEKYGVINLNGESIVPIEYKSIRFNGTYITAKGYEEEQTFNEKGEKITNGLTGMKKVSELDVYITTDKGPSYGIVDSDKKVLVPNNYLYIDYAFGRIFCGI